MKVKLICCISLLLLICFVISCESETTIEFKRYYSVGATVYQAHCQNCHGVNGEGFALLVPPLNDSAYLKTNKRSLACYIKSGLKGTITVSTKAFDDAMPPNDLSTMEIAQVLTYVGNSFGNKMGTINQEQVETYLAKCR